MRDTYEALDQIIDLSISLNNVLFTKRAQQNDALVALRFVYLFAVQKLAVGKAMENEVDRVARILLKEEAVGAKWNDISH